MVYAVAEKQIFEFVEPYGPVEDKQDLTLETRLFADLGVDGDDGHELLDSFAARFSVDMTGTDSFCYFDDEPPKVMFSELTWLIALLNDRFRAYVDQCLSARKEITIGDLYVSARLRRWDFPEQGRVDAVFETWPGAQLKQVLLHVVGGLLFISAAVLFESWNLGWVHVIVILALLWLASALFRFGLELRWLRRLSGARKAAEKRV